MIGRQPLVICECHGFPENRRLTTLNWFAFQSLGKPDFLFADELSEHYSVPNRRSRSCRYPAAFCCPSTDKRAR